MFIRGRFLLPFLAALVASMVGCGTEEAREHDKVTPVAMDAEATAETDADVENDAGVDSQEVEDAATESEEDGTVMFGVKPVLLGTLKSTADSRYVKYTIPKIKNTDMSKCAITDLRSNEVDDSGAVGDLPGDFIVHSALTFSVRAEALRTGTGRVYDITVSCTRATGVTTHLYQVKVSKPRF